MSRFSPYVDNGGTVIAASGDEFATLIADTRMSSGLRIHTRNGKKSTQLTSKCVIASCGMNADATTLHKVLLARIKMYADKHRREMSITAIAQMLSTILYQKRFFPYYTFNILAGVDNEGKGAVYHYDAIGSFERVPYTTDGSGKSLAMSILDNQILKQHQIGESAPLTKEQTIELLKDSLTSVGERDINTGDSAEVFVIDAVGVQKVMFELRKD